MNAINITGAIQIESDTHTVEYEPGVITGARTLYLRIKNGNKNVPIFVAHIDEVIEMLQRGKRAIEALEEI